MNFKEEVLKLGIELKDGQLDQFEQYYRFLIEENRKMNLTAITEQEEVYRKHFLDSLEISRILPVGSPITLLDVGSRFSIRSLCDCQSRYKSNDYRCASKKNPFFGTIDKQTPTDQCRSTSFSGRRLCERKKRIFFCGDGQSRCQIKCTL